MNADALLVELTRGQRVESVHLAALAVADAGGLLAAAGDPESICFFRSSAKPFQAIPMLTSGAANAIGFLTLSLHTVAVLTMDNRTSKKMCGQCSPKQD